MKKGKGAAGATISICISVILAIMLLMVASEPKRRWVRVPTETGTWQIPITRDGKTEVVNTFVSDGGKITFFINNKCPNSEQVDRIVWDAGDGQAIRLDCNGKVEQLRNVPAQVESQLPDLPIPLRERLHRIHALMKHV